jgi:hypothetical protein
VQDLPPARQRLITITDVDAAGARHPVLATADRHIVEAVERAVRERVAEAIGATPRPDGCRP